MKGVTVSKNDENSLAISGCANTIVVEVGKAIKDLSPGRHKRLAATPEPLTDESMCYRTLLYDFQSYGITNLIWASLI